MQKVCVQCGKTFEAKLDRAMYCSGSCRALNSQGVAPVASLPEPGPVSTGMLDAVTERVTDARLLGTPEGEAAIDAARRLMSANDGSYAGIHRQLMASLVLVDKLQPKRSSVDELRLRRDRKRSRSA